MKRNAFTLIELMVVIAIIGILGVSFAPAIGDAVMKARVARTIALVNTLETACDMMHGDTGNYALEYGHSYYAAEGYHWLSYNPGWTTWAGPYLKQPLTANQNLWGGGWIYLYNYVTLWASNNEGFDLTGDGTFDKVGGYNTGNLVVIPGVPQKYAQMINDKYDTGVAGDWTITGKVRFLSGYYLTVYLGGGA